MRSLLNVLALIGVAATGAVVVDLLADLPRVAVWAARWAEGLLRPDDRPFFGMVAEVEVAAGEAAEGERSRLSVLRMALGMVLAALRHRVASRRPAVTVKSLREGDWVKIALPVDIDDAPIVAEWVWAERIGDGFSGSTTTLCSQR